MAYSNNHIGKPWLLMLTRKKDIELSRQAFAASQAGIIGGFDSQREADAAIEEWLADPTVPHDDNLVAGVVYDPVPDPVA